MDFTTIIKHFQDINGIMVRNLTDTCIHVIYYMILIDLTLTFLYVEEDGLNVFIKLMRKIFVYGFFIYMIKNFTQIVDWVLHGFIQLGNLSTNGGIPSTNLLVSPGEMFTDLMTFIFTLLGLGGATVALDAIPLVSIESVPTALLIFVFFLGLGALFIGIEITIIFIKFFIVTATSIILMPFGAFKKTQDIAVKGLHALFAQGIEIMFVTIILNFYKKYKDSLFNFAVPPQGVEMLSMFQNLGVMILFIFMVTKIPTFVAALLSGSISSLGITNARMAQNLAARGVSAASAGKTMMSNAFSRTVDSYTESSNGVKNLENKK
ncbi:type IV secretion system protein [Fusobacterium varium]|uniref:type IV secretion system protein n=1 Tax=Fusobacterium varium TaxID=856 RepID=UPI002FE45029